MTVGLHARNACAACGGHWGLQHMPAGIMQRLIHDHELDLARNPLGSTLNKSATFLVCKAGRNAWGPERNGLVGQQSCTALCADLWTYPDVSTDISFQKILVLEPFLDLCVSSLREGHASLSLRCC